MKPGLLELFAAEGVVALAEHRAWRSALRSALRRGEIVAVLRGIYCLPEAAEHFAVRCRAVMLADPDAVLQGEAAAALAGWASPPRVIEVRTHRLHPRRWLRVSRRRLRPEQVSEFHGIRVTDAPTTALDNAVRTAGGSLDEALRTKVPPQSIQDALAQRRGRRRVRAERRLVHDSRGEPWSFDERQAHLLLYRDRIGGWVANRRTPYEGGVAYLDIALEAIQLAFEIDGDQYHLDRDQVLRDRARDQALAELGWQVVRFRAVEVLGHPDRFRRAVQTLIDVRCAQLGNRRGRRP